MTRTLVVDLLGFTGGRGGTETYAREITGRLPALLPGTRLAALVSAPGAAEVRSFFPGDVEPVPAVGASPSSWAAGEVIRAERAARGLGATALWAPANFGPVRRGIPRAVTIHDLIYHQVPGAGRERLFRRVTAELMARSALTADAVIAVSHATGEEVHRRLGLPADRVHVVPNGTTPPPVPDDRRTDATGRRLVLSTGNRMPHKNHVGLLEAVAVMPPASRPDVVITGGGTDDPLAADVHRLGLQDRVQLPGWVSGAELEELYRRADVYVCPSLLEGFGLPVLDALGRACVVVANDIPVLREVGGDTVFYTDAEDPGALARTIDRALASADDETRRAAGRAWAGRFTWDAAAAGTAAVLDRLLDGRAGTGREEHRP
ncbi:glycosyltransferase family 4 protein [Microbacterium sp. HMH0099]|uniref:glycosyltransferase family 4 protein n=1 Tax=Microbacterium sp. HMH0099 TaxID=3414026 RepID=UPI003BF66B36